MIFTTPPIASDPYNADCGPRRTSMRSTSARTSVEKSNSRPVVEGSLTRMPSIRTRVWRDSPPRMRTVWIWPGPPFWVTVRPGERRRRSPTSRTLDCSISSAVMTVTALPARWIGSSVRLGVTTMSGVLDWENTGVDWTEKARRTAARRLVGRAMETSFRPTGGIWVDHDAGRSPGLRVRAAIRLPDQGLRALKVSGFFGSPLAAYSCGGSSGIEPLRLAPDSRFTPALTGHQRRQRG